MNAQPQNSALRRPVPPVALEAARISAEIVVTEQNDPMNMSILFERDYQHLQTALEAAVLANSLDLDEDQHANLAARAVCGSGANQYVVGLDITATGGAADPRVKVITAVVGVQLADRSLIDDRPFRAIYSEYMKVIRSEYPALAGKQHRLMLIVMDPDKN